MGNFLQRCGRTAGLLVGVILAGCTHSVAPTSTLPANLLPVQVATRPLAAQTACSSHFVAHALPHTTSVAHAEVGTFDGNGSGLALGDLNDDGLIDIVFANLDGPNTLLWNQGNLHFRTETFGKGDARAAAIVDVDGDERLDIVLTQRQGPPLWWRNTGEQSVGSFVEQPLTGVNNPAYAMNWADLTGDGRIDLVTGSYDAELQKQMGYNFQAIGGAPGGVYLYTNKGDSFDGERLNEHADALAIAFPDLNADGRRDILVGNDFERPDSAWLHTGDSWVANERFFSRTSFSTMGFDLGDIDNSGQQAIFATDMKPVQQDVTTLAAWLPMMAQMSHNVPRDDPQIMENVLQMRGRDGRWQNQAYMHMVDATGWSWSGKFGDLDNDGSLDLYVVNGMIASGLFRHIGGELVEQNQARRNNGTGGFVPAPEWALDATTSGRGMSMADLDGDGDLDIVVNNLRAPAQLFENQLCNGVGVELDLRSRGGNSRAIGAVATLRTSMGNFTRDVRALSGYASGDAARLHFGLPRSATVERLDITWPDGQVSSISQVAPQTWLTITR